MGLAHALAAHRAGLKTAVIDRDARAAGASIRNFGFITVTGQQEGITWRRAMRSRDVWAETGMGDGCRILVGTDLWDIGEGLRADLAGALYSPHELRVESRFAVGQLTAWLAAQGVTFLPRTAALAVESGRVDTPAGRITADHIVVCPGTDLSSLYPEVMARRGITLCKLHMLRVADPGFSIHSAVMSDLGLVRYLGYAGAGRAPGDGHLRHRRQHGVCHRRGDHRRPAGPPAPTPRVMHQQIT